MHARLFTAIWPSPEVHEALLRVQRACNWPATARTTRAERLHLTLHFIGNVDASRLEALGVSLAVPFEPFEMTFDRFEVWRGGIAALIATRPPAELLALHARLAATLRDEGLPVEERPYRPHVTLARQARGALGPPAMAPVGWHATEGYALVRTMPGGAYESLARFA